MPCLLYTSWVDKNGTVYTFYENGVKDSNGTDFFYDPPASGQGTDDGSVVELYRNDGTLVKLTQNEMCIRDSFCVICL